MAARIPHRITRIALPPFDPMNSRAADLRAAGHRVISLGQAVPFFPPPPQAIEAATAALTDPGVHRYTTDPGRPGLRRALAARLGSAIGTEISRDELIVTAGANHAFALALATLVDAGDEVILSAPYFTNHHMMTEAFGAVAVEAPLADRVTFRLAWPDIEPHVSRRTRAVVLCNPSNPTGAVIDPDEGERLVGELSRRGILVISDEAYMPFVYEGAHWSAAAARLWRDNVIVIGTFSKMFGMMGWRVGYLLADAAVCAQAVKVQDAMIICAPTISQIAGEAAVREAWEYPRSFHSALTERRQVLAEALKNAGLSWRPTPGGFFAFVRVPACTDSAALSLDLLERAHVVTLPGSAFGSSGEGYLRLSYGCASSEELREAGARLANYFGSPASAPA